MSALNTSDSPPQKMFAHPFSFTGRIRRLEFGLSVILCTIINRILNTEYEDITANAIAQLITLLLLIPQLWFIIAQGVKRCHDLGVNGWLVIIPFFNPFALIFKDGQFGNNMFGTNPKGLNNKPQKQDSGYTDMEKARIRNLENVTTHRKDICKALGIPFTEDMITNDFFIGRFYSDERSFLNAKGLINRGFCPLCGVKPIDERFFRQANPVTEYLCAECYTRTNPVTRHADNPGYFARRIIGKGCVWIIVLGLLWIFVMIIRGCAS